MPTRENIAAFYNRYFAGICIFTFILGILAGSKAGSMGSAIPWVMAFLMFSSGLGLRVQDLNCLRGRPWLLPLILVLLHIVIPVIWMAVSTVLGFPIQAVMGFTILAMIPISASCIVWIGVHRANITLGMALILVDTLVTPFIMPYALAYLFGADVRMDPLRMLYNLFWMLFFPTLLALVANRITNGGVQRVAGKSFAILGKLSILVILFINGGVVSPYFHDFNTLFFLLFAMTLCCSMLLFLVMFISGKLLFSRKEDIVAFMLTSVRGTTVGLVIAMTYFSPLTTLTVAFNMLVQQPLGAWTGKIAMRYLEKRECVPDPSPRKA